MTLSVSEMTRQARAEISVLSAREVRHRLTTAEPVVVLDVREADEYARGHLPGAINIPRGLLEMKADPATPMADARLSDRARTVIAYCTGGIGARSILSAQVLTRMGFTQAACLDGGLQAWKAAGGTVEEGAPQAE